MYYRYLKPFVEIVQQMEALDARRGDLDFKRASLSWRFSKLKKEVVPK
jgi:hypothetical protein